jgi:acyl-CoA synthetase (AMP-forming)/AMP-acid ligase II
MFDSNDLADNRPFLIEIAGRSGLHSNSSVRADALRLTEEEEEGTGAGTHRLTGTNDKLEAYPTCFAGTGASAHRLIELATLRSPLDASSKSYEDLFRKLLEPNEDGHPEQHGGALVAVDFDQPLFTRLAEIIRCLCHNIDFELHRNERQTASGELREKTCRSLDLTRSSLLATRDFLDRLPSMILNSRSKIGIASSGTTGKPKWVYHRMDTLARSVKVSSSHRDDVWGLAYSPDRFAGMQVILQAICNRNTIVSLLGLPPDEIHAAIETYAITRLSATPTWFRLLVNGNIKHETVSSITVGGEVCHPSLLTELQRVFPNAKFRNIYASTEAGALFHSDADTFIVTEDRKGQLRVEDGQLWLHETLIAESLRGNCVDAFFPTGDEVEIVRESPLTLRVLARRSDWINVGGVKVNPHAVEDALLQIVGIREARVLAQKNSVVGNLVCAEIVLDKEVQYTVADIRRILSSQLDNYSIPRIIQFVDKIGISPSGKKGRTV